MNRIKLKEKNIHMWKEGDIGKNSPLFLFFNLEKKSNEDINIFDHLKNNQIKNFVVASIIVGEMTNDSVRLSLEYIKKNYKMPIYVFAFSNQMNFIVKNSTQFKWIIGLSWKINLLQKIPNNLSLFYKNKKEISELNKKKYQEILEKSKVNIINYKSEVNQSWNLFFDHVLKSTYVALNIFEENNCTKLGKYIHDGSNISYINNNIHLKIHFNNNSSNEKELNFVSKTHYKKDYYKKYKNAYLKKFYIGSRKEKLTDDDLKNLIKEINKIHKINLSNEIEEYEYDNYFDNEIKVMSHGDLNSKNVIFSTSRAYLIDFEWSMIHSYYWDLAHLIWKFNLEKNQLTILKNNYIFSINDEKLNHMIEIIKKVEKDFFDKNKNYFPVEVNDE
ncbi:MAG: phosphotransferase [Mycoplasmatales bacterium]|nr:phosphotransferase [Mycoplasmatales bacterium]